MNAVVSTHAVFDEATGDLLFLAPEELCPPESGSVTLPDDFADWSHMWDAGARAFVPNLAALKIAAHAQVKALRELAKDGGLVTPFGPLQTDPDSRTNINGAVQMAVILGDAFAVDWRMSDDSMATLDAAGMVQMGLIVGQHVSA